VLGRFESAGEMLLPTCRKLRLGCSDRSFSETSLERTTRGWFSKLLMAEPFVVTVSSEVSEKTDSDNPAQLPQVGAASPQQISTAEHVFRFGQRDREVVKPVS